MSNDLPDYYFRIRENGAFVFRVDTQNRQRRIEMDQIATINIKNGEIKPHGDRSLSKDDLAAITAWQSERNETLAQRDLDDMRRTVEQLNLTAHWVNSRASDDHLEALTEPLLMAMHDLRAILVRKKTDRVQKDKA